MRPAPSGSTTSDIQELHVLRVLLDEQAAGLDLVAHQRREDKVGGGGVLDVDTDEESLRRVHGRRGELAGLHLAGALEAADLDALLGDVDRAVPEILVGLGAAPLLAQRE